eukprot:Platyproteum_vivax@DN7208_c0_g1_i3.p1
MHWCVAENYRHEDAFTQARQYMATLGAPISVQMTCVSAVGFFTPEESVEETKDLLAREIAHLITATRTFLQTNLISISSMITKNNLTNEELSGVRMMLRDRTPVDREREMNGIEEKASPKANAACNPAPKKKRPNRNKKNKDNSQNKENKEKENKQKEKAPEDTHKHSVKLSGVVQLSPNVQGSFNICRHSLEDPLYSIKVTCQGGVIELTRFGSAYWHMTMKRSMGNPAVPPIQTSLSFQCVGNQNIHDNWLGSVGHLRDGQTVSEEVFMRSVQESLADVAIFEGIMQSMAQPSIRILFQYSNSDVIST